MFKVLFGLKFRNELLHVRPAETHQWAKLDGRDSRIAPRSMIADPAFGDAESRCHFPRGQEALAEIERVCLFMM
jgi:hypothetical protein